MEKRRRILCAVDIVERDRRVFDCALAIARRTNAKLLLLHVVSRGRRTRDATDRLDFLRELRNAAERRGVEVVVTIEHGSVPSAVLRQARSKWCDLIVLGGGREAVAESDPSIAQVTVRRAAVATCVVTTDHGRTNRPLFDRVVCATEASAASVEALREAGWVMSGRERRITLVHAGRTNVDRRTSRGEPPVDRAGATALKRLQRAMSEPDVGTTLARVVAGDLASEIVALTSDSSLVVVSLAARERSYRIFKSLTVSRIGCPILVLRTRRARTSTNVESVRQIVA